MILFEIKKYQSKKVNITVNSGNHEYVENKMYCDVQYMYVCLYVNAKKQNKKKSKKSMYHIG